MHRTSTSSTIAHDFVFINISINPLGASSINSTHVCIGFWRVSGFPPPRLPLRSPPRAPGRRRRTRESQISAYNTRPNMYYNNYIITRSRVREQRNNGNPFSLSLSLSFLSFRFVVIFFLFSLFRRTTEYIMYFRRWRAAPPPRCISRA